MHVEQSPCEANDPLPLQVTSRRRHPYSPREHAVVGCRCAVRGAPPAHTPSLGRSRARQRAGCRDRFACRGRDRLSGRLSCAALEAGIGCRGTARLSRRQPPSDFCRSLDRTTAPEDPLRQPGTDHNRRLPLPRIAGSGLGQVSPARQPASVLLKSGGRISVFVRGDHPCNRGLRAAPALAGRRRVHSLFCRNAARPGAALGS